MGLPTQQTSIPSETCLNSWKQEEGKLPQGAGFSHPCLFVPLWASDTGSPLWHESHRLEPESQQDLMGWGAVLRLPALSTPGAAGWTSGVSLRAEAAPSRCVSDKTETQGSAGSPPRLHL